MTRSPSMATSIGGARGLALPMNGLWSKNDMAGLAPELAASANPS